MNPLDWTPQGIKALEPEAEGAVKSSNSSIVVAGPGAGKTELLAQRACYLLQTGLCPNPRAILAISFKRDAARNLYERVRLRCGPELARRFHSHTFDAFAKSLVDRFSDSLPGNWRPIGDYAIDFKIEGAFRRILGTLPANEGGFTPAQLAQLNSEAVYKQEFIGQRLSTLLQKEGTPSILAALAVWKYQLTAGNQSALNFHMIGRLAEHILHTSPQVLRALRATYAFVFLDEFQDTTGIHYDLTVTAFRGSDSVLTAVGDVKQSIMRWAMALTGIFERFRTDFQAAVFRPRRNYRSAPRIVAVVGHLAAAIEHGAQSPQPYDDGLDGEGECRLLAFPSSDLEAAEVARLINTWIHAGVTPRDICVLTRQKPEVYGRSLVDALSSQGIVARVESKLQDLLAEPVTTIVLDFIRLAIDPHSCESWKRTTDLFMQMRGCDDDRYARQIDAEIDRVASDVAVIANGGQSERERVRNVLVRILGAITGDVLKNLFPQYSQGSYLNDQLKDLFNELLKAKTGRQWQDAVATFEGVNAIPIMTVHKSKGLEYHSVVFLGLEDYVFRSFQRIEDDEESCAFFVALSRARKRILFTSCDTRQGVRQSTTKIRPLFELLRQSGVVLERIDTGSSVDRPVQ